MCLERVRTERARDPERGAEVLVVHRPQDDAVHHATAACDDREPPARDRVQRARHDAKAVVDDPCGCRALSVVERQVSSRLEPVDEVCDGALSVRPRGLLESRRLLRLAREDAGRHPIHEPGRDRAGDRSAKGGGPPRAVHPNFRPGVPIIGAISFPGHHRGQPDPTLSSRWCADAIGSVRPVVFVLQSVVGGLTHAATGVLGRRGADVTRPARSSASTRRISTDGFLRGVGS